MGRLRERRRRSPTKPDTAELIAVAWFKYKANLLTFLIRKLLVVFVKVKCANTERHICYNEERETGKKAEHKSLHLLGLNNVREHLHVYWEHLSK